MNDPVRNLWSAVYNEGPRPDVHRAIMARHRQEWPTLWEAIDAVLRDEALPERTITKVREDITKRSYWLRPVRQGEGDRNA